jgi:tRNA pseudouridine55 synthase
MKKQNKNAINGWINLSKPLGITSADAVNKVKWLLRPQKIGHAGTLDPLATGVLPLALGEGTKCVNLLMDAKKTYEFAVTFGERRATDDAEGEVVATSDKIPTETEIRSILPAFTGTVMQLPPAYSALKVAGKRAYDLARAGEEVVLQPRPVTIYALEFLGFSCASPHPEFAQEQIQTSPKGEVTPRHLLYSNNNAHSVTSPLGEVGALWGAPGEGLPTLKTAEFRAKVSKGTYIRSLGRDIAHALGSEGYISRLHRAAVGPFTDRDAISLDFLAESVHNAPPLGGEAFLGLTPLHAALDDIPALALEGGQVNTLRHGQRVTLASHYPDTPLLAVLHQGQLVGLARVEGNQVISVRLLNT